MKCWKTVVAPSILLGAAGAVFGAAGTLQPDVTVSPLQINVTYSETSPVLNTYAGFTVTGFGSTGPNTINDLTVMIEAKVTDGAEKLALHLPEVYLAGLPANCDKPAVAANPLTITCRFKQFRSGDTFPPFTVFYKAPVKVVNGDADGVTDDYISMKYTILYAEGLNDCANGCVNSLIERPFPDQVLLGTTNPTDVKSGVPKNGAKLFLGTGVPKNEENKKFTVEAQIPPLSELYATATLKVQSVSSTDSTPEGVQCGNLGNFVECPTYTTQVVDPKMDDAPITFTIANPLKQIYRIDGANVKRSANQLLNNVQILYYPDGISTPEAVQTCTNDQADPNGIPCVLSFQCYKPNEKTPDLARDCEFVTIGLRNGRLTLQ